MKKETSLKDLKNFAALIFVICAFFTATTWAESNKNFDWWFSASVFFLGLGLLYPELLKPVYRAWMALGHVLGFIMTRVILTILFFLIITPLGIILRRKDLLGLKRKSGSYWQSHPRRAINEFEQQY